MGLMTLCRVLHIAATCTSLGGLFYARAVLWPTLGRLPAGEREEFLAAAVRRFAYIKWAGVAVVAVTGVVQWLAVYPSVLDKKLYLLYFALKMVGAVGLFGITFLLALPAERLEGMRRRRAFWSGLNVLCGLTILVGAALMRTVAR
ncbi:MAG TPA: hypothetical protein VD968_14820 [Pyrinomonadaceae bacterium]|nr:hypothetical protein [Pyrinomonadaceae bacterium]